MEEKAVDEKATSRRSRKDQEGRDFQCGCGKRYLSYPALYTHIKTKHDGRQPEGTLKTGATQLTKRGKSKLEDELLRSICSWLQKQDLMVLIEVKDAGGSVPLGSRLRKDLVPKEIYECYHGLMKEKEVRLNSSSSVDLALTIYLLNVGFHVNDKLYENYVAFARIARSCFYEYGQEVFRAYFSRHNQGGPFVMSGSFAYQIRFFPIVADFLLQCYIPQSEARELNVSLMQLLLYDFCNWLFTRKLSLIRPSLPRDYRIDYLLPGKHRTPSKNDIPPEPSEKENREEHEDQSDDISENQPAGHAQPAQQPEQIEVVQAGQGGASEEARLKEKDQSDGQ